MSLTKTKPEEQTYHPCNIGTHDLDALKIIREHFTTVEVGSLKKLAIQVLSRVINNADPSEIYTP